MRLIDADVFVEDLKTEALNLYLDGMKGTPRPYKELYDIIDRINEQPTIEQPQWISCAERLPTEDGICLVYQTFNIWGEESKIIGLEQFSKLLGGWYCDGAKITNVTHWMPLPQPPKGDE